MVDEWISIASTGDVDEGHTLQTFVGTELICVYRIGGRVYATQDTCTHGQASLSEGTIVEADCIECPFHQGLFHIPTGRAVRAPCVVDLRTYETCERDGEIRIRVASEWTLRSGS